MGFPTPRPASKTSARRTINIRSFPSFAVCYSPSATVVDCTSCYILAGHYIDWNGAQRCAEPSEPDSRNGTTTSPSINIISRSSVDHHRHSSLVKQARKQSSSKPHTIFQRHTKPERSPWYRRGLGENQAAISSLLGPVLSRCDSTNCLGKGKVAVLGLCGRSNRSITRRTTQATK